MELFSTSNTDIINDSKSNISFMLPSEMIEIRKAKFEDKFNIPLCFIVENIGVSSVVTVLTLFI